jgi:hypothetical protein
MGKVIVFMNEIREATFKATLKCVSLSPSLISAKKTSSSVVLMDNELLFLEH